MRDFFQCNTLDQIVIRFSVATKVEALKQILHHRPHFPELAAQTFLQCIGCGGIRFVGGDRID